jgi:predicted amidohydrolase YtcJ
MIKLTVPAIFPVLALIFAIVVVGCSSQPTPAELILVNGKLVTVDADRPEAQALAASGGRIVAVGTDEQIERYRGPDTRVVDLQGNLAIPGLIEGHAHFLGLGRSLMIVDLKGARSWSEIVERVAEAASRAAPGEWIQGRGWHQEKWDETPSPNVDGYPVHDELSRATPDNPVVLDHASGHAVMVNALAMKLARIDATTPDPDGGQVLHDAKGRPIGVLRETAEDLVGTTIRDAMAARSEADLEQEFSRQVELATQDCLSKGVTSFHDAGASFASIERLRKAADDGRLGVRLWVMIGEGNEALKQGADAFPVIGEADQMITVRGIKRYMDGAVGSHSAWFLEPYIDVEDTLGLNTLALEELEETAEIAVEHGLQLCVHAIGDRANREVLDVYEQTFERYPDRTDLRWRIEHAQHLDPADIPRFAELDVIASMQPVHCTSDGPWVPERLGDERCESGAYVWRSLIDSGAVVSNGTDAPVEDVDPLANFLAAVSRRMRNGEEFYPGQRMTREEALRAGTLNAAYSAFEEETKGSLTPGKLADVVVLSRDIMSVPVEEISETEVLYTIVGGEIAYTNPSLR